MEQKDKINAEVGRELDDISDKIDHKEIHGMFGIDAESLLEEDRGLTSRLGSFGHVFHGDTANAWRFTSGMLPGRNQRYLEHDDYREQDDDTSSTELTDLHLPPETNLEDRL